MTPAMPSVELLNMDCGEIPIARKGIRGFQRGHKSRHWVGRKHTEATRAKMRAARLKNQPMHKKEVVAKRSATLKRNGT